MTAQSYLAILNDYFYPVYCDLPGNESIFFMQDDVLAHYASNVPDWPDLTPAEFFLPMVS